MGLRRVIAMGGTYKVTLFGQNVHDRRGALLSRATAQHRWKLIYSTRRLVVLGNEIRRTPLGHGIVDRVKLTYHFFS